MGLLYGVYGGRSDAFMPGSCSYETGFCPHGVSYDEFKQATESELKPMRVHENTIGTQMLYCFLKETHIYHILQLSCSSLV